MLKQQLTNCRFLREPEPYKSSTQGERATSQSTFHPYAILSYHPRLHTMEPLKMPPTKVHLRLAELVYQPPTPPKQRSGPCGSDDGESRRSVPFADCSDDVLPSLPNASKTKAQTEQLRGRANCKSFTGCLIQPSGSIHILPNRTLVL